jgi:hypothetical protein
MLPILLFLLVSAGAALGAADVTPEGCFEMVGGGRPEPLWRRSLAGAEHAFMQQTRWEGDPTVPPVRVLINAERESPSLAIDSIEGGGVSVTLRVAPSPGDQRNIPLIAASLLLRSYYAKSPPVPGSAVPRYPDWLLRGLGASILGSAGDGAVPKGQRTPELAEFLCERVPDPDQPSMVSDYDRRAAILVRSGLHDDAGRRAFRDWIGSNNPSSPVSAPGTWVSGWDLATVERRWVLGLHSSVGGDNGQRIDTPGSAEATLSRYDSIMTQSLTGKISLAELRRERGGGMLLGKLGERLAALRLQANPVVVPLIDESMNLVRNVRRMSDSAIRREEGRLAAMSADVRARSAEIADYLNWYEAARSDVRSGLFDDYLSARPPEVRKGPLGRSIDAVESRGW